MTTKDLLIKELEDVPDNSLDQILDFVKSLKKKKREGFELSLMSESSLAKDWQKPEDDEAWQNL